MMKYLMLLLICGSTHLAFAQEPEDREQVRVEIDIAPGGPSVHETIEASHSLIEGDESGKFIEDWKEAVNFKKKLIDAYRWISASKNASIEGIVLDSVLLFGLSHSLETSSGPILVTMGISNGWPEWLTAALGVGGTIISVPGLDPLCIAIFGIYSKSPKFRFVVGKFRLALVRSFNGLAAVTGAREMMGQIFRRPDYREWMSEISHLDEIKEMLDGRLISQYSYPSIEDPQIKLEVHVGNGRAFVKKILVKNNITVQAKELSIPWLKKFGWNTRNFVEKFVLPYVVHEKAPARPYIESIQESGAWKEMTLLDSAIKTGPLFEISVPAKAPSCRALFAN